MSEITRFEWAVLDSLSNDVEAVALITNMVNEVFPDTPQKKVAETVYKLFERGLIFENKQREVDFQTLINEPTEYLQSTYRFGLTEAGSRVWEENALRYTGETVDWSKAYAGCFDFTNKAGRVEATSSDMCLIGMEAMDKNEIWLIDRTTIAGLAIDGFMATYHKHIPGGYRITFKLKPR